MADAAPLAVATTHGWDTVYAVRIAEVNERICATGAYPPKFSQSLDTGTDDITVSGTFQAWSIGPGGAGYLVYLRMPIAGQLTAKPKPGGGAPFQAAFSGTAIVAVELCYLAPAPAAAQKLQVASRTASTPDTSQLFDIQQITLNGQNDPLTEPLVKEALQAWLHANSANFQHVFAVVTLQGVDNATWLTPTAASYAYVDAPDGSAGLLAVLAMTNGRAPTGLDQQVDDTTVPPNADAALLISGNVLLDDIIRPSLPASIKGVEATNFSLDTGTLTLSLVNPCQLAPVSENGNSYTPTLQSLSIQFRGTYIELQSESSIYVGEGVTAYTSTVVQQGLTVTVDASGNRTLAFTDLRPPVTQQWTETDPTVQKTYSDVGWAIAIAGTIAATVATVLTGGLVGALIAVGTALISGVVADIPTFVAAWDGNKSPSIDLLAANATAATVWSGGTAFALANVDLVDSLRLSGSPWSGAKASA